MDIDLSKVIGYSKDSLKSRTLMRAIMEDLLPDKTRKMNVLLRMYSYAGTESLEYARKEGYQIENASKLKS